LHERSTTLNGRDVDPSPAARQKYVGSAGRMTVAYRLAIPALIGGPAWS
jgi:hypothetical protein